MLNRLGNKKTMAVKTCRHFPAGYRAFIDLFFGAGGIFFSGAKARFNFLNDIDDDIANLYLVVQSRSEELISAIQLVPISTRLLEHWKLNKETDPIKKAVRFLFLSNFTYLGKGDTLRMNIGHPKQNIIDGISKVLHFIGEAIITNYDFREVVSKISFSDKVLRRSECFLYLDPPYLDTEHNYGAPKWAKDDTHDCLEILSTYGMPGAMSEFNHPFVISNAQKMGLNIIHLGGRRNIKNRGQEVLITNYQPNLLFM